MYKPKNITDRNWALYLEILVSVVELEKISVQSIKQNRMFWAQLNVGMGAPFSPSFVPSTSKFFPPLPFHLQHLRCNVSGILHLLDMIIFQLEF